MKVLITTLNAKYIHSNLALRYLYAATRNCDSVEIKEFTINNDDDYIFGEIIAGEYDVIGFSCYIWNIQQTLYLSENIKKAQPGAVIVFGGPETSYDAKDVLRENGFADFVVIGEGEYTFGHLLKAIACGGGYEELPGLAYRSGGEVFVNMPGGVSDFESVPFPYALMPREDDKIVYYESSRGCPFSCAYCISSLEKKMRSLPLDRVLADVDYFIAGGVKQVKFIDRTFNWEGPRCREILKYIISRDSGAANFHFEICGELIDDDFISVVSDARKGLFQFEVGIQSTNKKTLSAVRRSADVEMALAGIEKLTSLGNVEIHVDLIAGLPFEGYESFKKSFNDVYRLGADAFQLGFLKLLKGTQMREDAGDYGYEFRSKAPYEIISNAFLSAKDVCRLKQIERLINLYYNRGGFEKSLKYATEVFAAFPFDFFEEFSIFFRLKGFQGRSHKKEDLYRIFYEYGGWKSRKLSIPAEHFRSLLEDDMKNTLNPDAMKRFARKGWGIS